MKLIVAFLALAAAAQTPAFAQSFHPGNAHGDHGGSSNYYGHGEHHHSHSSIHVGLGFYPSPYYYAPYSYPVYGYGYPYAYPYPAAYYYSAPVSSRAATGMAIGSIAGAAIGSNSSGLHHDAWAGAAIGAASGWLLGSIADSRAAARENERAAETASTAPLPTTTTSPTPAPAQTAPQTVIINNNYYGNASPMSSANSLFGR
jgi:hypothetical protein